eukprot:COSAG03_NODE_335_length_8907_cov_26.269301_6_plen_120_part_00
MSEATQVRHTDGTVITVVSTGAADGSSAAPTGDCKYMFLHTFVCLAVPVSSGVAGRQRLQPAPGRFAMQARLSTHIDRDALLARAPAGIHTTSVFCGSTSCEASCSLSTRKPALIGTCT